MDDTFLNEPRPSEPQGPLARLLGAVTRGFIHTGDSQIADEAKDLQTHLDEYSEYLDRTWPGSCPTVDGSQARDREARLRERVIQSRARVTAANGWATVAVKASAVLVSLAVVARLFGV